MRETLDIFVMIEMLLLFTVLGLPAPHRHVKLNIETAEDVSRTETNLYQEYQVQTEKPQLCVDPGNENFVIEPDLRGDI